MKTPKKKTIQREGAGTRPQKSASAVISGKRLIEVAFPLRQASLDSVHEKNVRHGHISTLHIWPARRPLAACRAALIATLLPDPKDGEKRTDILQRLGGSVKKTTKKKTMPNGRVEEIDALETEGGILHWGRESGPDLEWFRREIRKTYGDRAPKVLDPFAGGGAIPLEAMRLGCDVTASDLNPVAWFILKCTLEYPQRLAGKKKTLPDCALQDAEFMAAYLKAGGMQPAEIKRYLPQLHSSAVPAGDGNSHIGKGENLELLEHTDFDPKLLETGLAWHVRAWGRWVLKEARKELARFYPTYAEYCALKPYRRVQLEATEPYKLVPVNEAGEPQAALLNAGFDEKYLKNPENPRWVAKPTVAYLWARTVKCKACHATVPLLKTRWLVKKSNKRVLLTMHPRDDQTGVIFGIDPEPKAKGGNAAQRREYDKRLGAGTMSRAGVTCPCCGTIMTMQDLRLEGRTGKLSEVMTAVVVDSPKTKEYRLPTAHEIEMAEVATAELEQAFAEVPFGLPTESTPKCGSGASRAFSIDSYNLDQWRKLFVPRQLLALGVLVQAIRKLPSELAGNHYPDSWIEAIAAYTAILFDKTADYGSAICTWHNSREIIGHTFARFALPMVWDMAELAVVNPVGGAWLAQLEWVAMTVEHTLAAGKAGQAHAQQQSATQLPQGEFDIVVTDPPYYDAIPYSDLMDFFYIWLRRTLHGLSPEYDTAFAEPLSPKWNHEANDGELIDDAARFGGDRQASKSNYEAGMARAFTSCHKALRPEGRLVIVFAHKHPDAWETLVTAIIKAGFVVVGSWPIQTEMGNRMRAFSSAALSSSVWLVCRKRDPQIRAGWDTRVLEEMQDNIVQCLRDFWDAGIRGPDFLWAATGPAMEAYSRYPAVRKTSEPGALLGVDEFLRQVRRIVVDFVVGRVLTREEQDAPAGDYSLDDVSAYYLLHRNDFDLKAAPAGPCILYMVSCGLSEHELADQYGVLARPAKSRQAGADAEADNGKGETEAPVSGGEFKLKSWSARRHQSLGENPANGRPAPLIDQVHKLMHLWQAGDVAKVNQYIDRQGLRHGQVFAHLVQALIEKSRDERQDDECSILERLANHLKSVGSTAQSALVLGE